MENALLLWFATTCLTGSAMIGYWIAMGIHTVARRIWAELTTRCTED